MKKKIGYVQNSPQFGDKKTNFSQLQDLLKNISADLIVLPELFATGYTFTSRNEVEMLAESDQGETAIFMKHLSLQTGAVIVGGFIENSEENYYNSAMIVDGSGVRGIYRKVHLFNKEKLWFKPGNEGFKVFDVMGMKIGVMICFDWIFPESARSLALNDAEIIAHPANLVLPYCQKAMTTRCIENHIFAITSNRIGVEKRGEDKFDFTGGSQITDLNGNILSSAPKNTEFVDIVEVDLSLSHDKSLNPYNNLLTDRKPKFYTSLNR
ncbi:Nitrilase [Candidatus Lokiarchaeum ossiferum]|uniref:Nitrilase n=1 Tax=Candidatus Lokiarchaeum ossiferum TaxID=2951803 RepID=A0ABY6HYK6_9ARCH|nr:Nitrilase [Candidatus Lokiarchaeum sp. B-35]